MLRLTFSAIRCFRSQTVLQGIERNFSILASPNVYSTHVATSTPAATPLNINLCDNHHILQISQNILTSQQNRSVVKFSLKKGKRKTVKAVIKRFFRLDWGEWIRTKSGRHKKMWRKTGSNKRRLRQHVFVNGSQSFLLDKMVTNFWKRPKYYVDDPYTPYQSREECLDTRRKPFKYQQD